MSQPQRTLVLPIVALTKVIIFFSLEEKYGNEIKCQVLVALFRYILHAVH